MRVSEVNFMKTFKTLYFILFEGMSHWKKIYLTQLKKTTFFLRPAADRVFNTTEQKYEIDKN